MIQVKKCARTCVHKFLSLVFHTHTPDSSPPLSLPLQIASPLSPAAPTRYVLEPTQVASAVHQLPRTSVADLREGRKHLFGERLGGAAAGVARRVLTPPRRGGRVSVLEIQVPLAEGGARAFPVSDALPHPPPTFVLSPLPLGSGWGRSLLPPCGSREGWARNPVPERAEWARRPVGSDMGTLLASPARKSLPRAR